MRYMVLAALITLLGCPMHRVRPDSPDSALQCFIREDARRSVECDEEQARLKVQDVTAYRDPGSGSQECGPNLDQHDCPAPAPAKFFFAQYCGYEAEFACPTQERRPIVEKCRKVLLDVEFRRPVKTVPWIPLSAGHPWPWRQQRISADRVDSRP